MWRFDAPVRCASSAVLGGGVGERAWIVNATVPLDYAGTDPAADVARIAASVGAGVDGSAGIGLLTAVPVSRFVSALDDGAEAVATVGLGAVTWAAGPPGSYESWAPGTVNVVAWVPEPLSDAALVNLVATVAEAKAQAFGSCGVAATGTPSDAVVVCCPAAAAPDDDEHRYGGPRSLWGARVARAAHDAVAGGIHRQLAAVTTLAAEPAVTGTRSCQFAPPPGEHGGDGARLGAALGVDVDEVLDLSATLNPCAPDVASLAARHLRSLRRYPDDAAATDALADAMGVRASRVVLTNGGAEAIALVAAEVERGWVEPPEFSLYERHLVLDPAAGRWRSNPRSPTGELAAAEETAAVWDEAFFPLATGAWTRGDGIVVGSLTKLFACPGLRAGYVVAPDDGFADAVRRRRPAWSVSGVACSLVPELLELADLAGWCKEVAELRGALVDALDGFDVHAADAPWVLVRGAGHLRERLARSGVLVRDCASFGLVDTVRIAVPDERGLGRLRVALGQNRP